MCDRGGKHRKQSADPTPTSFRASVRPAGAEPGDLWWSGSGEQAVVQVQAKGRVRRCLINHKSQHVGPDDHHVACWWGQLWTSIAPPTHPSHRHNGAICAAIAAQEAPVACMDGRTTQRVRQRAQGITLDEKKAFLTGKHHTACSPTLGGETCCHVCKGPPHLSLCMGSENAPASDLRLLLASGRATM
jgi:hypothetical protein